MDPLGLLITKGKPYIEIPGLVIWEDGFWPVDNAIAGGPNLSGVLFTNAPNFFTGQLFYEQALTGTTFTKAPTFHTGTLGAGAVLSGVLFTKAPTFSVGEITGADLLLQGTLFTKAPSFFTGTVGGGAQALTGQPFQVNPSFFEALVFAAGAGGTAQSPTDEGLRFEVWTLPQLGSFTRKYDLTRWVNAYTVSDKFGEISDGRLTLDESLPDAKLDQLITVNRADHSNDEGSVIRVLRGTTPLMHYVTKQFDDTWSSDDPTANLSLEGMELLLDRAIVPRKDYPTVPSVEPDWIYGAQSVLINTAFDDPAVTSELVTLTINATGGTFKIQTSYPNGDPFVSTANIPFNATAQNVADAIEAAGDLADVLVSGEGTTTNPFVIEALDPAGEFITWATDSSLLTGLASFGTLTAGGNLSTEPWTRSLNPTNGVFHGSYTTFEISTEQFHSAPYSLKIDGDPPASQGAFPGAQQLLAVTPGRSYRASVWVRPTQTGPFRFVIRTRDETFIAQHEATLTGGTWTQMSIPSVVVPTHVSQIIFRIATISNGDEPAWYVDDALFAPGADAATYGAIMNDVTDAIVGNGVLTWLTRTWTDTHDSSGVVWDRDLEWSVKRGQTVLQLMEYATRWNYEWRLRWDNAESRFEWDLFNPTEGGTDYTGTGLAITGRSGVTSSGVIARRFPEASYYQAEGEGGQWGEHTDATMESSWGRLEQYFANVQGLDAEGLTELAERLVADATNRTDGLSIRLQVPTALPWSKFQPGDVLKINLADKQDGEYLRCMAVVASMGPNDSTPAYDCHFGSVVYQGEAAVLQTLRILWRAFKALQAPAANREIINPVIPTVPDVIPTGRSQIIIASFDTNPELQSLADYVVGGDHIDRQDTAAVLEQIKTDLDLVDGADNKGAKGEIIVLDGTYYFNDNFAIDTNFFGRITFKGEGAPRFVLNYNTPGTGSSSVGSAMFNVLGGGGPSQQTSIRFINIIFDGAGHSNGIVFSEWTLTAKPVFHVYDCVFTDWALNLWWSERQVLRFFRHNLIQNCDFSDAAFHFDAGTAGPTFVTHNNFSGCSGNMVSGFNFADHTLIQGNFQTNGTMVANAQTGVTYADNLGF